MTSTAAWFHVRDRKGQVAPRTFGFAVADFTEPHRDNWHEACERAMAAAALLEDPQVLLVRVQAITPRAPNPRAEHIGEGRDAAPSAEGS